MKVLLLMKGNPTTFLFIILYVVYHIPLNVKQNLGHAWFLGPHTLSKLILLVTYLSVKKNIDYAWFLGPYTLGKLMLLVIYLSVKQNFGHA